MERERKKKGWREWEEINYNHWEIDEWKSCMETKKIFFIIFWLHFVLNVRRPFTMPQEKGILSVWIHSSDSGLMWRPKMLVIWVWERLTNPKKRMGNIFDLLTVFWLGVWFSICTVICKIFKYLLSHYISFKITQYISFLNALKSLFSQRTLVGLSSNLLSFLLTFLHII